jgi:hypothetical protein
MQVENYFQPPLPEAEEESQAFKMFMEDFGRWLAAHDGPRPFEESTPYYVQLGYGELISTEGHVCLLPDHFGKEHNRLRAGLCAAAMIDQDMHQLFRHQNFYPAFRTRFAFPKLAHKMAPINFVDSTILEDKDIIRHMKCLYLLAFRWLSNQTEDGGKLTSVLYKQLYADNVGQGTRHNHLWYNIFAAVSG